MLTKKTQNATPITLIYCACLCLLPTSSHHHPSAVACHTNDSVYPTIVGIHKLRFRYHYKPLYNSRSSTSAQVAIDYGREDKHPASSYIRLYNVINVHGVVWFQSSHYCVRRQRCTLIRHIPKLCGIDSTLSLVAHEKRVELYRSE